MKSGCQSSDGIGGSDEGEGHMRLKAENAALQKSLKSKCILSLCVCACVRVCVCVCVCVCIIYVHTYCTCMLFLTRNLSI